MTPPSGGPVRPLFNYKLSISVFMKNPGSCSCSVTASSGRFAASFSLPFFRFLFLSVHRCCSVQINALKIKETDVALVRRRRSSKDNSVLLDDDGRTSPVFLVTMNSAKPTTRLPPLAPISDRSNRRRRRRQRRGGGRCSLYLAHDLVHGISIHFSGTCYVPPPPVRSV